MFLFSLSLYLILPWTYTAYLGPLWFTLDNMDFALDNMDFTMDNMDFTLDNMDLTLVQYRNPCSWLVRISASSVIWDHSLKCLCLIDQVLILVTEKKIMFWVMDILSWGRFHAVNQVRPCSGEWPKRLWASDHWDNRSRGTFRFFLNPGHFAPNHFLP